MINPDNGRAHIAYLLETGVARSANSRLAPLRYLAAVERGFARRLGADRNYAGLVAKNSIHPHWRVEWHRDEPYTLTDLADWLYPCNTVSEVEPEQTFGAGRNCMVFDQLRLIPYREVRQFKSEGASYDMWLERCVQRALGLNLEFPQPMKFAEVRAITRWVAKWTWKHFSDRRFRARQSLLGRIGNAHRWAGHEAACTTKPWEAMCISRTTYYRRKASGTL